jgi:hypothetical protein
MLEEKIRAAQEIIQANEKNIEAQRGDIDKQRQDIENLSLLQQRLQRIHVIRYLENLGNFEHIASLANKTIVKDFLQDLDLLVDTRAPGISDLPLLQLTLWQMLYLLYGDLTELDKKLNRAEAAEPSDRDGEE